MDFQVSIITVALILAFYLPGYFFRRWYYSGFSTKQVNMEEWYDRFFKSIFYGMIVQFLVAKILRDNFHIKFDTISQPINQFYSNISKDKLPDLDYTNFRNAILYLIFNMAFASAFGLATRKLVRLTRLDILSTYFRYANIWHYYFRGDIMKTSDFKGIAKKGKWVSTRADILVDFVKDEKNVLYTGILSQYDLSNKSDKIERIYLTGAQRYSTKDGSSGFKPIPGDIFIVDSSRIININLTYDFLKSNQTNRDRIVHQIFNSLSLLVIFAPIVIVPYLFYGKIGLLRIALGIFESVTAEILLFVSIEIFLTNEEKYSKKYKGKKTGTILTSLLIAIIFVVLLCFTVNF